MHPLVSKTLTAVLFLLAVHTQSACAQPTPNAASTSPNQAAQNSGAPNSDTESAFSPMTPFTDSIETYSLRYGLRDLFGKLVSDNGTGYEDLYGVRNFRMVLAGVAYRGGANNSFNRFGKRPNSNPLPTIGLQNLCQEGFDQAVYLYSTNYNNAPHTINCRTRKGENNTLTYFQYSPLLSAKAAHSILELVHAKLVNPNNTHPLYMHCWNGWHASGYISALNLRQFCGMSGEDAVNYWNRNTDGNTKVRDAEKIRSMIRSYQVDPALSIPANVKSSVCRYM